MRPVESVVWNLFLALIPVALGFLVARVVWEARAEKRPIPWLVAGPLLFLWLIFLPNTCYLLTEWRHYLETLLVRPRDYFDMRHDADYLFSFLEISLFYVFYSGCGLLTFFVSIWTVDRTFRVPLWGRAVFFLLCSLGVYLGLVKRFNSWQVVRHSGEIWQSIVAAVVRPELDLLIVGFAAALWVAYLAFEVFMDGLELRRQRMRKGSKAS